MYDLYEKLEGCRSFYGACTSFDSVVTWEIFRNNTIKRKTDSFSFDFGSNLNPPDPVSSQA